MPKGSPGRWHPSSSDYHAALLGANPWHQSGEVPEALARAHERPLATHLWRRMCDSKLRRFQLILGPRRTGKSTCLWQTARQLISNGISPTSVFYLSLDTPILLSIPLNEIVAALLPTAKRESHTWLLLDEIVAAKDWDLWLKTFYDQHWPISIVASSSATAALRHRSLESGVGRWEESYLGPCLFDEYFRLLGRKPLPTAENKLSETIVTAIESIAAPDEFTDRAHLQRYMLTGGFPELLLLPDSHDDIQSRLFTSQRVLREQAVQRAIYQDIPQVYNIDNPTTLERLTYILAAQIACILSPTSIASDLGITPATVDKYISYLERSFLVFTLPNFSPNNERAVQRRGRKAYFVDGAVRNAALQRGLAPLTDANERGHLFENLAAAHLHTLSQQSGHKLYYWRDGKQEVDLVYHDPAQPMAFEVASSHSHHREGLRALIARHPEFRGNAYIIAPTAVPTSAHASAEGIGTVPLATFLLSVGCQHERALAERFGTPPTLFTT